MQHLWINQELARIPPKKPLRKIITQNIRLISQQRTSLQRIPKIK
jgi:hypothetical protein